MNSTRITLTGAGLALTLALTACGGSDDAGDATTLATTIAAADTESANSSDDQPGDSTDEISPDDVPATDDSTEDVDDAILSEVRTGSITVDGVESVFSASDIDFEFDLGEPTPALLGVIGDDGSDGIVIVPFDPAEEAPAGPVIFFDSEEATRQTDDASFAEGGDDIVTASGVFDDGSDFDMALGVGTGTSTFELDGNRAIVRGDLGSTTFEQVQYLIDAHPEVDTLVLQDVPGSVNDEVNVQTGRLVREAGYTTIVPSDGSASSGGVDLFAAGVDRIAEPGAMLGIHSWCCTESGVSPADLPEDDPQHDEQLAYFSLMLGDEAGPDFYFQTLNAAPADDIYFMTDDDLAASTITTNR